MKYSSHRISQLTSLERNINEQITHITDQLVLLFETGGGVNENFEIDVLSNKLDKYIRMSDQLSAIFQTN